MEGEKKPWTLKRFAISAARFTAAAIGIWSGLITIANEYGFALTGFAATTAQNAWWLFPVASFFCGVFIGWGLRQRAIDRDRASSARMALQKQREEEAKKRREILLDEVRMLDPDTKALFKVIGSGKTAYGNTDDWRYHPGLMDGFLKQFVVIEHIDRGRTKITASELAKVLVEEEPGLFSSISGTVEAHRRDSQPAGHISRSDNGEALPFWWWVGRA